MCGSQYSSLLKMSENIKDKFEDSLDCLCVWHLGAVICGAKTCYLSATYYNADPRGLFLQKVIKKAHM